MSFRFKVLISILLLISVAFGVSGYFLINHTYHMSLNREIQSITNENQLISTALDREIIDLLVQESFEHDSVVKTVGQSVSNDLRGTNIRFALLNNKSELLFSSFYSLYLQNSPRPFPDSIFADLKGGNKSYAISDLGGNRHEMYCASSFTLNYEDYHLLSVRDITGVFTERNQSLVYFRGMAAIVIAASAMIIFLLTYFLTRPIARLDRQTSLMASGNYSTRANIRSSDEMGQLALRFNQMADAIEHTMESLVEEGKRKEEFVANFTHELKTPLTSMIGFADRIRSSRMSEKDTIMAANYIFTEGMRLETMSMKLFDLLLLAKDDIKKRRIYLPDFLSSISQSVSPMMEKADVSLLVHVHNGYIAGDADLLKTVFINLIDNAIKASKAGQSIEITSAVQDDYTIINIRDCGKGIPEEDIKKITEPFYMVDKSRSRESGGTGLGLSLAFTILQKHGATMHIKSVLLKGTTISIGFLNEPLHDTEAQQ